MDTRDGRGRPAWYLEVTLLVGGYVAFGLVRAWLDRGEPAATGNALLVQGLEQNLHLAMEYPINNGSLGQPVVLYSTGYFYRLCLLSVPVILVWLYARRPAKYRYLRTVLVVTTVLDLPLVWIFPESPPRFSLSGVVDYIATHNILNGAGSGDPRSGLNLFAAMPSMHVAWTTWCAYALWSVLRADHRRVAWLAWLFPAVTSFVVLATGHHYVLDIVAGMALVAVAVGLTRLMPSQRMTDAAPSR